MTTFTVWAPAASQAAAEVAGQRYPMRRDDAGTRAGWWSADVPNVAAGIDYGFPGTAESQPANRPVHANDLLKLTASRATSRLHVG